MACENGGRDVQDWTVAAILATAALWRSILGGIVFFFYFLFFLLPLSLHYAAWEVRVRGWS